MCWACGKLHPLLLRGFNEAHPDGVAEAAGRRLKEPPYPGEKLPGRGRFARPSASIDRLVWASGRSSAAAHPLRANLPDRGSEPRVARFRVPTALAVLPTNRPMSRSKLTSHSSDPEP